MGGLKGNLRQVGQWDLLRILLAAESHLHTARCGVGVESQKKIMAVQMKTMEMVLLSHHFLIHLHLQLHPHLHPHFHLHVDLDLGVPVDLEPELDSYRDLNLHYRHTYTYT